MVTSFFFFFAWGKKHAINRSVTSAVLTYLALEWEWLAYRRGGGGGRTGDGITELRGGGRGNNDGSYFGWDSTGRFGEVILCGPPPPYPPPHHSSSPFFLMKLACSFFSQHSAATGEGCTVEGIRVFWHVEAFLAWKWFPRRGVEGYLKMKASKAESPFLLYAVARRREERQGKGRPGGGGIPGD